VVVYNSVNPTKIHDVDEVVNLVACEVHIEAVNGLVIPTKIYDEGNVETAHEAVCLDGVNPQDEYDDDLLATKVGVLSTKYDVEHLSNEGMKLTNDQLNFDGVLIFIEDWLAKPKEADDDSLLVAAKVELIEEIDIYLKEEKNEKNEYSSYYNILCNLDKVYEYAGEKPDE